MNKEILMEQEKAQKFIEDIEKSDKGEIDGLLLDEDFDSWNNNEQIGEGKKKSNH